MTLCGKGTWNHNHDVFCCLYWSTTHKYIINTFAMLSTDLSAHSEYSMMNIPIAIFSYLECLSITYYQYLISSGGYLHDTQLSLIVSQVVIKINTQISSQ